MAACQQRQPSVPDLRASGAPLHGTWLQSVEEVRGDTLTFRPNTYRFPPTRLRPGFRLGPFGRFTQFDVLPGGGLRARPGTWAAAGARRLLVCFPGGAPPGYILEVLKLDKHRLLLRRRLPDATLTAR